MSNKKAVKSASDTCLLLAKYTLSDLVGQRPSLLIINFEQVIKAFLIWIIYFTFFLPLVDCTFTKALLRVAVFYYHVTYTFQSESTVTERIYSIVGWAVTSWKYSCSKIHQTSSFCYVAGF